MRPGNQLKNRSALQTVGWIATMLLLLVWSAPGQEKQPKAQDPAQEVAKTFQVVKEVWATPFKAQGETRTCWAWCAKRWL